MLRCAPAAPAAPAALRSVPDPDRVLGELRAQLGAAGLDCNVIYRSAALPGLGWVAAGLGLGPLCCVSRSPPAHAALQPCAWAPHAMPAAAPHLGLSRPDPAPQCSGGMDVDILPKRASKGRALAFLLKQVPRGRRRNGG